MDRKFVQKNVADMFRDVTSFGGTWFIGLFLLFVLAWGQVELFWELFAGVIIASVAVVVIRTFYYKDRPNKEKHSSWVERIFAASFPSLHTARALFIGLVLIDFFQNVFVTWLLALAVLLVAGSRMYLKKHDSWDVVGGVVLGFVTYWVIISVF